MQAQSIELPGADGIQLSTLVWSEVGTPLLFVHGYGNDAHVWDEVAPRVAPHYRTAALTLRGHGDSGRGAQDGLRLDALVADLEAATAALGAERLVLVGHSLGGRVAMRFAGRHPERMAGLVLVDAGPEHDRRGSARIRAESARDQHRFASTSEYLGVLERHYPAARRATLARLAEHWLRRREDGRYELKHDRRPVAAEASAHAEPSEAERSAQLWDCLRKTPCPALVVRGAASDVLSQEVAERMAERALPNGRLVVIEAAGHSVMLDNPEAFGEALCDFVLG